MVKIRASEEGIKKIHSEREKKGWSKDQNSEALITATQQQFEKKIKEHFHLKEDQTSIPIDKLEELLVNEKVFTDNANFQKYLIKFKNSSKKPIGISLKRCLEQFQNLNIHTPGITYRNWQYFLTGKEIPDDIFEAFCTALGIEKWIDLAIYPPIFNKNATDQTRLVEGLSSFNHRTQIKLLKTNFSNPNKPFLVANTCKYSQTWMLRRLELEIENTNRLKCKPFLLSGSQFSSRSINELSNRFEEQYPITRLVKSLKNENLLVVIDKPYDCKEIINEFWMPLVEKLTTTKTPGIMFMFLLSNNQANEREIESTQIIKLPPANPFKEKDKEDIVNLLLDIGAKMQNPLSQNNAERIADSLIQESNGDTLKLLQEIYKHFKSKTKNFSDVWQKYP